MEKDKETTIQQQFGKQVRTLRFAKSYSQEELAFRAKIHRTYLGGIERGERNPSLKNIAAIAEALGVSLAELFESEVDFKGEEIS
jgi:transcriptional regulator with XRE-family HTH domain